MRFIYISLCEIKGSAQGAVFMNVSEINNEDIKGSTMILMLGILEIDHVVTLPLKRYAGRCVLWCMCMFASDGDLMRLSLKKYVGNNGTLSIFVHGHY